MAGEIVEWVGDTAGKPRTYKPVILYRPIEHPSLYLGDLRGKDPELDAMVEAGFRVYRNRSVVDPGELVVGRYSVLPFYKELEDDLANDGAILINRWTEHQFLADVMAWAPLLKEFTPTTWTRLEDLPDDGRSFVVKGQTNSRKDRWNTHMFAKDKRAAVDVTLRLQEDSLISSQRIYYREYVPLWEYTRGLNDLPVTEEYRYFICDGQIISKGFYWSSYVDDLPEVPKAPEAADMCVITALNMLRKSSVTPRFLVIDVARKQSGQFMVVELNDAQMSGLSENDPKVLYKKLFMHLTSDDTL